MTSKTSAGVLVGVSVLLVASVVVQPSAGHEVLDAKYQHRQGDRQNDKPVECLQKCACGAIQALRDLDQIEMVDAPCGHGHSDEDAPGEESRGDELQPEERSSDRARHDVEEHRTGETCDGNSAQHHQDMGL